jgi:hypothetical protein
MFMNRAHHGKAISRHIMAKCSNFFLYAHFCSGSVTVTVCGVHPKFVRDFSEEMKQPYSGCPEHTIVRYSELKRPIVNLQS